MLIIRGKTRCPMCGEVLAASDEFVPIATGHLIDLPYDPVWQYHETALHKKCFANWELRDHYIATNNSLAGQTIYGHPVRKLRDDGSVVRDCN